MLVSIVYNCCKVISFESILYYCLVSLPNANEFNPVLFSVKTNTVLCGFWFPFLCTLQVIQTNEIYDNCLIYFSAEQKTQKIVCVPCTFKKLRNEATRFCKTCEDPEPMCETCAEHHTLQQISRNHELSADIQELFSRFDQLCVYVIDWYLFFAILYV